MNRNLIVQHIFRAWSRHWSLQFASVTVMTMVLVILNLLFLGFTSFNEIVGQWGKGLEMVVYLKDDVSTTQLEEFSRDIKKSGEFDVVEYTPKEEATKRFLHALGPESADLLKDPKWKSPLPSSFELKLSEKIPLATRVETLQVWRSRFLQFAFVDDVFYGQGWVENFSQFLINTRGLMVAAWILSLSVGLLIVGNCIRLSFLQRRSEIEVLELVGATQGFIRLPFLIEGLVLGLAASVLSLVISFGLHSFLISWLLANWSFWFAFQDLAPLQSWHLVVNLFSGVAFGVLGAWNCVRKLNTGWSAAAG